MKSAAARAVEEREARLGFAMVAPALGLVAAIAVFPILWTVWESLHLHDLRMPWRGRPFVGLGNYLEAVADPRVWAALGHTVFFTIATVALELILGLFFALALHRASRGRGLLRTAVLLPWAIPTVVAALVWGFMFETRAGIVNALLVRLGAMDAASPFVWFTHATLAWVPVILADTWKTTPFVTLLLLAGLQGIDESLYEAARVDGASASRQFVEVTLPMLRPALVVTLVFRTLDAFRCFDLIYVLTKGGPGTSTEPISLYAFNLILNNLRFGYGSAVAFVMFLLTFLLALAYIRFLGARLTEGPE